MKLSIRSKFFVGMVFLVIILVLSIFSAYYMNKLSKETGTILKENYLSLVYAREMAGGLTNINQEITNSFLTNRKSDSLSIRKELNIIDKSLQLEKNNFTEPGEDKLVLGFETGLKEYRDSIVKLFDSSQPASYVLNLQKKYSGLYQQLMLLSQMNGKAIEVKTDNNKISSQEALTQMTIIATLCFIIALFYSYSFSSYSNERFSQLYNGIKEIRSNDYAKRLNLEGTDEFYEISLIVNEMADKINENIQNTAQTSKEDFDREKSLYNVQELQRILGQMKSIEKQAVEIIAKFESNI